MKPILFSTKMVQAILGDQKTMTRRVIKVDDPEEWESHNDCRNEYGDSEVPCFLVKKKSTEDRGIHYPKYDAGDVLWVRETFAFDEVLGYAYKASCNPDAMEFFDGKWLPSIHMPKEAARIFLKVIDVRAERLQSILCGDMKREGCIPTTVTGGQYQQWQRDYWIPLWDGINAERGYSWDSNPWVWVYGFERCDRPQEVEG